MLLEKCIMGYYSLVVWVVLTWILSGKSLVWEANGRFLTLSLSDNDSVLFGTCNQVQLTIYVSSAFPQSGFRLHPSFPVISRRTEVVFIVMLHTVMVQKALFRRPRVHWPFKYDATNVHFEQIQTGHLFFVVVVTQCLDPRQQGTVFKILDTQQSETLTNFPEIARLIPIRTQDICLEISSDCKYCLGLKVEATVVLGHRVKSQSFRHLENIQVHTQLPMNIHRNYQRNFTRVFSVRQEIPSDYKKGFILLWTNYSLSLH